VCVNKRQTEGGMQLTGGAEDMEDGRTSRTEKSAFQKDMYGPNIYKRRSEYRGPRLVKTDSSPNRGKERRTEAMEGEKK